MREEKEVIRIVDIYMNQLLRIAGTYLKNAQDAEDVVQDVLIRYLQRKEPFAGEEHERAWLVRVTIHRSVDYWRAIKRRREQEAKVVYEEVVQEDPFLMEMLDLPEKYRTPMYLHYIEGYTIREVADILRKPTGTIATRLTKGKKLLKDQWKEGMRE